MKKEILIHTLYSLSFAVFVALFRGWIQLSFWPFFLGFAVGTFMPNIDYLIYSFFLRPQEFMSQRTSYLVKERKFAKVASVWADVAREGSSKLIFHTYYLQIIFMILTFWVVSSSGSIFGTGLVLAFSLHLLVDQFSDFEKKGSISGWFRDSQIVLNKNQEYIYFAVLTFILLLVGFVI